MRVYDCFTFYNELELLELRLKALWDVVDCFVIVEADKKHTNEPKPFYFWERQDEFREFFSKIRHLPVEMTVDFKGVGDWSIENAQRDAIAYGLSDAAPDDLIMISDLDEIPSPDVFRRLKENTIRLTIPYFVPENQQGFFLIPSTISANDYLEYGAIALEQNRYYYYFDLMNSNIFTDTVLTKRKNLTTPQELRNLKDKFPRVSEGGYHFSYMGGVDRVINKMTSIVDGNAIVVHSGGKLIDRKHIEEALANGTDIYNRPNLPETQFHYCDAKNIRLPYLDEFLRKYPNFLREPEKYFGGSYGEK
ncbi:MAG: hypothetical protein II857_01700 [Selenomonadaceae bacterium]|nr:hypothetical protein [Selenomonadaceae bacterium]